MHIIWSDGKGTWCRAWHEFFTNKVYTDYRTFCSRSAVLSSASSETHVMEIPFHILSDSADPVIKACATLTPDIVAESSTRLGFLKKESATMEQSIEDVENRINSMKEKALKETSPQKKTAMLKKVQNRMIAKDVLVKQLSQMQNEIALTGGRSGT